MNNPKLQSMIRKVRTDFKQERENYKCLLMNLQQDIKRELKEYNETEERMPCMSMSGVPSVLWDVDKIQEACTRMKKASETLSMLLYLEKEEE